MGREMGTVRRRRKVPRLPLAAQVAANTASARRYVPRDASWTARLPQPICHHFQRLGCQTFNGTGTIYAVYPVMRPLIASMREFVETDRRASQPPRACTKKELPLR